MRRGGKILACVVIGLLAIAAFGWITQLLWNWIVPALFAGPVINFWQALGLLVLSKILFSGLGRKGFYRHGSHTHPAWKQRLHEKFSGMTPEEREAFKKKLMNKWCSPQTRTESGPSEEKTS